MLTCSSSTPWPLDTCTGSGGVRELTGGQQGCRGIGGYIWKMKTVYCKVLLKTADSLLQTTEHEVRSMGPKFHTTLGHQMPLLGVHLTECQPDPKDLQMSRWPKVVPFWVTRCLYWRYVWAQVNWTYVSSILGHQMPLPGGTSDWMSARPNSNQMSRWPDVVPLLLTRCLYRGVVWMSAWPKGWPNVKLTCCSTTLGDLTRCLYQGGTFDLGMYDCKCQADLMSDCKYQADLM